MRTARLCNYEQALCPGLCTQHTVSARAGWLTDAALAAALQAEEDAESRRAVDMRRDPSGKGMCMRAQACAVYARRTAPLLLM